MSGNVRRLLSAGVAAAAIGTSLVVGASAAHAASAPNLASGATLASGQELDDAQFRLVMQGDGNLVEYADGHAIWSSQTQGNSGAYAVMQTAGNLVVYPKGGGTHLWANSGTGVAGSILQLQPDGNVVIVSGHTAEWDNGGRETTVYSGQTLTPGEYVESPSRTYELIMQGDGNLVLYKTANGTAVWDSRTNGDSGAYVVMQTAGNLVVYPSGGGTHLWANSGTGTAGAVLQVTDQGAIQIVSGATVSWTSTGGTTTSTPLTAKIVNTASSQSGYAESGDNCNKFSAYWGRGGGCEAWCADFAEWVWTQSGAETDSAITAGAESFETWGKDHGRWHAPSGYTPQPGDAVVYGDGGHVGIVVGSTNGLPDVINGNWGGAVSGIVDDETNQYGTANSNDILGYATPYAS